MRSKKRTTLIVVLVAAIAITVTIIGILAYKSAETNRKLAEANSPGGIAGELQVGDAAPDFTTDLLSGDTFTLSEHKGKAVFLNFWGTWCPPCVAEMPAIEELSAVYADDVVFIGVACGDTKDKVRDFITEKGITYHIGLDESGDIMNLYPTLGIPYTLVIDADGVISKTFIGGGDQMHDEFEAAITEALLRE